MKSCDWLDLAEVRTAFATSGLAGADLVRMLSWAGASRKLIATGFRQLSVDDGVASSVERQGLNHGHIWRYFQYAFRDGNNPFDARATMLEADWTSADFRYRIERSDDDDRPTVEVACWINWNGGNASYRTPGFQEVWDSILVDAPMVQKLVTQIAERANLAVLQDWEIDHWIANDCTASDIKNGWKEFRATFGKRTGKREQYFVPRWKAATGDRPPGRPSQPAAIHNSPDEISGGITSRPCS